MGSSQAGYFVVQFVASAILARLLSPAEFGIYTLATAISGTLAIMQATGLVAFVVREPEVDRDLMACAFTINALISIAAALVIAGGSVFAGRWFGSAGVTDVMLVVAVLPIVAIFDFLPTANLEREARFKAIALIGMLRVVIAQGVAVTLALSGFSYMSIAYGQVAGAICAALAFVIVGRRYVSFRLSLRQWRPVLTFGTQMLALAGTFSLGNRLSEILLGRLVGLRALGLYGRAASLNNLIQENVYMVAVRVLFVDVADQARRGIPLRGGYLATIEVLTALLWPAFAALAIVAGPFIHVVFGPQWVAAAAPLRLLALASMIHLTVSLSWQLFVVNKEVARQTRIEIFRTLCGVAMFAVGCRFGLTAAAGARVAEALLTVALYRPHIARMTETRMADFVPIYRRSGLLTLVTVGPAAAVMAAYGWSDGAPVLLLGAALALGALLWLAAARWLDHPLHREIRRLSARLLPRRAVP